MNSGNRIFYDHQIFTAQRYGGVSRYFFELIQQISPEEKYDVMCYAGAYACELGLNTIGKKCAEFSGVRRPSVGPLYGVLRVITNQIARAKLRAWKPKIYHETWYDRISCSPDVCRVTTVHDMIHELMPGSNESSDIARKKAQAVREADLVICVSESTRNDLVSIMPEAESKSFVVYHGSSLSVPADSLPNPLRRQKPYIVFVGRRGGYKNFRALIEACGGLDEFRSDFEVLCVGGGAFTEEEQEQLRSLQLSNSVIQVSADDEALSHLMHNAVAFVFPSLYEGFGIPVIEAMACECPVICSNSSSLPEAGGNAALYFDPGSVESLREVLKRVIGDSDTRDDMIRRGSEHVRSFSWKKCATETVALYESLM